MRAAVVKALSYCLMVCLVNSKFSTVKPLTSVLGTIGELVGDSLLAGGSGSGSVSPKGTHCFLKCPDDNSLDFSLDNLHISTLTE